MDTKLAPRAEQDGLKGKIGLYKEGLRAENPPFSKTVTSNIRGYEAIFEISAGPLKIGGTTYKETYVLEIRYEDSYRKHSEQINLAGFGSMLFSDYAQRVNEIALEYIQQQGWTLNDHINSWPEFQAIVTIKPVPKKKVRRRTRVQDQTASDMARILDMYGIEPRSI